MRKPIQITSLPHVENKVFEEIIFAVCDDGSIWQGDKFGDSYWKRLPDIPQTDEESDTI